MVKIAKTRKNYYSVPIISDKKRKELRITKYRKHDVGRKGHTYRLVGYSSRDKEWYTLSWHFSKTDVYIDTSKNIHSEDKAVDDVINKLGGVKLKRI